jgi:hypothetical protein
MATLRKPAAPTAEAKALTRSAVDRLPATSGSEIETMYKFSAVCTSADEARIRALVVQALTRDEFVLRAVHSEDLEPGNGRVEVTAEPLRYGRGRHRPGSCRQPPQP